MEFDLIKGDCLEKLKDIPNNSVDCFICDLPYGTTNYKKSWDKRVDLDVLWRELKRVARDNHTPYFFFCDMKLGVDIINANRKMFRYDIVIKKSNKVGFLNVKKMPLREHELLLVFYENLPLYNALEYHKIVSTTMTRDGGFDTIYGKKSRAVRNLYEPTMPTSIFKMNNTKHSKEYHRTQKSQDILEWIIKYYTKEGDTILDPTMGSGSTGEACITLNRNFIGIELFDEYFEVAEKRLKGVAPPRDALDSPFLKVK
jgi:DNA modification methylase